MAASEPAFPTIVCDAGPLIHLDEIGCLDLLDEFEEVLVPSIVWNEVSRHRPSALKLHAVPFRTLSAGAASVPEVDALAKLLPLHAGEREALILAKESKADLLLTDDAAARLAARNLAIPVHGTIGILFRSIRLKRKTGAEVAALLRSLPARSTLHLKPALLKEFIVRAEEASG